MILRDKLEKTGHQKPYHTLRRMMLAFFLCIGVFAAGAIPVGISYQAGVEAAAERSHLEDSSSSEDTLESIEEVLEEENA